MSEILDRLFRIRGRLGASRLLLLACSLFLTVVGVAFIHSATADPGMPFPSDRARDQILKGAVGLVVCLALLRTDYRLFERLAYFVYGFLVLVLAALVAVRLLLGEGLVRWIQVGFLNIQPSEIMKLGLVLALARYLRYRSDMRSVSGLVVPLALTLVPFLLVVAQPNLGTALMFPPLLFAILIVGGAKLRHLATAVGAAALLFPAILVAHYYFPNLVVHSYMANRLNAYLNIGEPNLQDMGYQLSQSLIAFRGGGLVGQGYHQGTQNTLRFLPESHTDFIFAVVGEEWGFLGAALVIVVFVLLVLAILAVALQTREPFGRLVVSAIAVGFAVQGFQNVGMTLGVTPITGVPLPFVSLGGSSLVASFIALGVVLSVASRQVRVVASQDLNPVEVERTVYVIDEHPAGAQRFS